MSLVSKLKQCWQSRHKLGDSNKARELAQFLPAALEIQEAPPNPIARWLARIIAILFILVLIWACIGQVNIVASADGKIIPSSRIKRIQPLEKAVVKRILVQDGDYVASGQPLIELDSTLTKAEQQRLLNEEHSAELNLAVSQSLLSILQLPASQQKTISLQNIQLQLDSLVFDESQQALHKRLLWQQWLQFSAQLGALHSTLKSTQAQQAASQEVILQLEQTLPIVSQRAEKIAQLQSQNYASENDYLKLKQELIKQRQDLAAEKQRAKQLSAAEDEAKQKIDNLIAQTNSGLLSNISDLNRQISSLKEELAKANDLNEKRMLYAPVSGQVQELAVNTVGGVVTEAQQLMTIVPNEEHLEVEVQVTNKDIGFLQDGMPAEIKIHTFPFTRYGVIAAEVTVISDDAIIDEQKGLIFTMRLRLKHNSLWVDGREVKLMPGMTVTAEVQTGYRRLIEFFMAPLLRYKQEGLRER